MTILVNGHRTELEGEDVLSDVLVRLGYDPRGAGIAVAVNGEVIPQSAWRGRILADDDRVEVLGATQGG